MRRTAILYCPHRDEDCVVDKFGVSSSRCEGVSDEDEIVEESLRFISVCRAVDHVEDKEDGVKDSV